MFCSDQGYGAYTAWVLEKLISGFALVYARPCPESCTGEEHLQQIGKFFAHLGR